MSQNQGSSSGSGSGCGCLLAIVFCILGFTYSGWWFVGVLIVLWLFGTANGSSSSSSSSSNNTTDSDSTLDRGVPEDIDNILIELSKGEIKDPVTQEVFRPGETVHLCLVHRLAYHEDSWREIDSKCMVCGNNAHTKTYTLPVPIEYDKPDLSQLIEFREIDE
jgi:hypothetical protein